jgi:hypothetical protein
MKVPLTIKKIQQKKDKILQEKINLLEQQNYFFLDKNTMDSSFYSFSATVFSLFSLLFPSFFTVERGT